MLALARIFVFIQRSAVKSPECKSVFGKMRGHPIHDYANAVLVKMIDEKAQVVRRSIPRGRCIVSTDLITPRWPIRVFFQRQEFDMCKSICQNVAGKLRCDLAVGERTIFFFSNPAP